jgi:hypothetical protein
MRVNRLTKCSSYVAKVKVANFGAFTDLLRSYMPLALLNAGVGCAAILLSAEQVSDCAAKGPASVVANSKGAGDRPEGCMILCKRRFSLAGPDLRDLV